MSTLSEWATRARSQRPNLVPASERPPLAESMAIGSTTSVLSFLLALHLVLYLHVIPSDAISRVANAYYVLFSRQPHLGAIGFVWNPLPSLLELPFTLLHSAWPALVSDGLAANIVSAAFAGLGAFYMNRLMFRFNLERWLRITLTAIYAYNPLILFYGANGMTDVMMVSTFLAAWEGALAYYQEHHLGALVAAAIWLSIAFLIRYEAVPFAALLALGLAFALFQQRRPPLEIEGVLTILLTPVVYVSALWIYLNWLIMKNPLYFLTSVYGNAAQLGTGAYAYAGLQGVAEHPVAVLAYVLRFTLLFWPIIPALVLLVPLSMFKRTRDARVALLLLPVAALPLLQAVMLYLGKSAGWDRFFLTYIPAGVLLVAFLISKVSGSWRGPVAAGALVVLLTGDAGTLLAMSSPILGHGDGPTMAAIVQDRPVSSGLSQDQAIARYIDRHPHLLVGLDTFTFWDVVLSARNPHQYVITSDLNFQSILHYPEGRISDLLVPKPTNGMQLDAVDQAYPGLWRHGESWAVLVKSFPGSQGARLYRILPNAPGRP